MLSFERRDPFPLISSHPSAAEKKAHSIEVDRWLGLRINEVEARLNQAGSQQPAPDSSGAHQNLWFGLAPQELLTPYVEIREVLERIQPKSGSTVVDLGAAYARIGFVLARHFPEVSFEGFEYVGERVREGRRALEAFGAKHARLHHADLTAKEFEIPRAQTYFIYDFGTDGAIERILNQLRKKIAADACVVARGRRTQYAIEDHHRWLKRRGSDQKAYSVFEVASEVVSHVAI
ncbi:MAG TPA: hypothetical protein VM432_06615 [Bdellovibrionales bacterium]|nr:hypothetical protein [Bdellovibrionales bacterium]